jgi:hypothetical protein
MSESWQKRTWKLLLSIWRVVEPHSSWDKCKLKL